MPKCDPQHLTIRARLAMSHEVPVTKHEYNALINEVVEEFEKCKDVSLEKEDVINIISAYYVKI